MNGPNPFEQNVLQFLAASGALGLLSSWILQAMKKSPLPFFNFVGTDAGKARMNLLISGVFAGFAAVGIHTDFGLTATGFHLAFDGTWSEMVHGFGQWIWQLLNNHAAYRLFIVPPEIAGETRTILRDLLIELKRQQPTEGPHP